MPAYSPFSGLRRLLVAICLTFLLLLAMWSFSQSSESREHTLSRIVGRDVETDGVGPDGHITPDELLPLNDTQDNESVSVDDKSPASQDHQLHNDEQSIQARNLDIDGLLGGGAFRMGSALPNLISALNPALATALTSMIVAPMPTLLPPANIPLAAMPTLTGDGGGAGIPLVPVETAPVNILPVPTAAGLENLASGLVNLLNPIVSQAPSIVQELLGAATSAVSQVAGSAQGAAANVAQIGNNIAENGLTPDAALNNSKLVLDSLGDNVQNIANNVGSLADSLLNAVPSGVLPVDTSGIVDSVKSLVGDTLDSIVAGENGPLHQVADIVHKVVCVAAEEVDGVVGPVLGLCGDMASASISIPLTSALTVLPTGGSNLPTVLPTGGSNLPTVPVPLPTQGPSLPIPNATPGGASPPAGSNSNANGQTPASSNANTAATAPVGSGPQNGGSGGNSVPSGMIPTPPPGGSAPLMTIPSETPGASFPSVPNVGGGGGSMLPTGNLPTVSPGGAMPTAPPNSGGGSLPTAPANGGSASLPPGVPNTGGQTVYVTDCTAVVTSTVTSSCPGSNPAGQAAPAGAGGKGPCPGQGYTCDDCLDGFFCPPVQTPAQFGPDGCFGWPCFHCVDGWFCIPNPTPAPTCSSGGQQGQAPNPGALPTSNQPLPTMSTTPSQPRPAAPATPSASPVTSGVPGASPTVPSLAGGWGHCGCWADQPHQPVLASGPEKNIQGLTNERCVTYCMNRGYIIAGTASGGSCFCGVFLNGTQKLDASFCSTPCFGDDSEVCGGDWALSCYSPDGEPRGWAFEGEQPKPASDERPVVKDLNVGGVNYVVVGDSIVPDTIFPTPGSDINSLMREFGHEIQQPKARFPDGIFATPAECSPTNPGNGASGVAPGQGSLTPSTPFSPTAPGGGNPTSPVPQPTGPGGNPPNPTITGPNGGGNPTVPISNPNTTPPNGPGYPSTPGDTTVPTSGPNGGGGVAPGQGGTTPSFPNTPGGQNPSTPPNGGTPTPGNNPGGTPPGSGGTPPNPSGPNGGGGVAPGKGSPTPSPNPTTPPIGGTTTPGQNPNTSPNNAGSGVAPGHGSLTPSTPGGSLPTCGPDSTDPSCFPASGVPGTTTGPNGGLTPSAPGQPAGPGGQGQPTGPNGQPTGPGGQPTGPGGQPTGPNGQPITPGGQSPTGPGGFPQSPGPSLPTTPGVGGGTTPPGGGQQPSTPPNGGPHNPGPSTPAVSPTSSTPPNAGSGVAPHQISLTPSIPNTTPNPFEPGNSGVPPGGQPTPSNPNGGNPGQTPNPSNPQPPSSPTPTWPAGMVPYGNNPQFSTLAQMFAWYQPDGQPGPATLAQRDNSPVENGAPTRLEDLDGNQQQISAFERLRWAGQRPDDGFGLGAQQ